MSTFREVFSSDTFAIPGYPGYYYRPIDSAVVSNKTSAKYTVGKELTIYTTKFGEQFVYALDHSNCRRKLMLNTIRNLLSNEIRRASQYNGNNISAQESQQINRYMHIESNASNVYTPMKYGNFNDDVEIDINGNIIKRSRPLIVFLEK